LQEQYGFPMHKDSEILVHKGEALQFPDTGKAVCLCRFTEQKGARLHLIFVPVTQTGRIWNQVYRETKSFVAFKSLN